MLMSIENNQKIPGLEKVKLYDKASDTDRFESGQFYVLPRNMATQMMIELANLTDISEIPSKQAQMIEEQKGKYDIVDLGDVIGDNEREKRFIELSELSASIRNEVTNSNFFLD